MSLFAAALTAASFSAAGWIGWRYLRQRPEPTTSESPRPASVEERRLSGSTDNWCKVLPGEVLLQHCHAQPTLDEILRQSRLAPEVFARDLRSAVVAYAEFVQLAPASESHHHAHPGGLLTRLSRLCAAGYPCPAP